MSGDDTDREDEEPPTLGVREPRRPVSPRLDSGAEAQIERESKTEAVGAGVGGSDDRSN